jgi:GNAT superfamily N-acetyltransferase
LPHPIGEARGKITICDGRQGIILNVFTEPEWRRRGIAALLMKTIIEWSREQRLDGLVLDASDDGRGLYEQLGFVSTNEMRFSRNLGTDSEQD